MCSLICGKSSCKYNSKGICIQALLNFPDYFWILMTYLRRFRNPYLEKIYQKNEILITCFLTKSGDNSCSYNSSQLFEIQVGT